MVHTRSGHEVLHMEASYGRAARNESKRQRRKRKLAEDSSSNSPSSPEDINRCRTPARRTRSQAELEDALDTPPSASNQLGTTKAPPQKRSERISRQQRSPRCSDFGRARHYALQGQGFLFCNACDLWDALLPDSSAKVSTMSRRFACTANHTLFSHPTSLRRIHWTLSAGGAADLEDKDAEDSDSLYDSTSTNSSSTLDDHDGVCDDKETDSCSSSQSKRGAELNTNQPFVGLEADAAAAMRVLLHEKEQEVSRLKGKVLLLQKRMKSILRKNKELLEAAVVRQANHVAADQSTSSMSRNKVFKNQVVACINHLLSFYPRWSSKRTGPLVAQAVWSLDVQQPEFLKLARKYFRDTIFTPYNVLKEMDLAGGTLSYEGIDVLRRVETSGLKRFRGSMIPSKSEIKRMAGKVEWFAASKCPFVSKETSKGEAVEFDYGKAMRCITQAFHLDEIGKTRPLSVASSIDGASLTKNLSIIAGGIKVTDRGARCPLTRQPLLDNPTTMKAQSRNLCIPLKIMMGRETKETFAEFATLFTFLDNLGDVETMPAELVDFMPFQCNTNCDLSAQWKGLCKGGAAKVHTLPCTGCATESDGLATPNARLCVRWCYERSLVDPEWMCYHKEMATPEHVNTMKTEVVELLSVLGSALEEILADSKMTGDDVEVENPLAVSTRNASSIHFLPQNPGEMRSFSQLLSTELMIRDLDNRGSMEMRRENLRQSLQREATIAKLNREIAHGDVREGAYFLLMNTLPCILHMENRNGIKLLTMIFIEGLSNAKKKLLYVGVNAEGIRVSRFIADVENIVNTSMLGSEDDPCQWTCPFDAKKKEICPITMDNVRTRRVVDSLDILVDFCVKDQARAALWMVALNNYRTAMILVRKRDDFTNSEIATYQRHADLFFQAWVQLWKKEGVTNYIHMIGSGHIAEYLFKWRNLYRYSQQGWEAMNSLVKTFFFRRTNHGGGVRGGSKRSRLIPIARWLQRRLVFLCGATTESTICEYVDTHTMPKVFRTQMISGHNEDDVYE